MVSYIDALSAVIVDADCANEVDIAVLTERYIVYKKGKTTQ